MNELIISLGPVSLEAHTVMLLLSLLAAFFLSLALSRGAGSSEAEVVVFFPMATAFSLFFARLIHWYCHSEQYASLSEALTRFDLGGFCFPGVLLGIACAVLLLWALRLSAHPAAMLDAIAPGFVLFAAGVRLSELFTSAQRGKLIITAPEFQHLPFASGIRSAAGTVEYHLASFFWEFLILLVLLFAALLLFRARRCRMKDGRSAAGNIASTVLILFCALQLISDSTRYDSSYLRSNGFVSLVQIVSAVLILLVMLAYFIRSLRAFGFRKQHLALWLGFLLSLGGIGGSEYFVQRHGNWFFACYAVMALSCALCSFCATGMIRILKRKS